MRYAPITARLLGGSLGFSMICASMGLPATWRSALGCVYVCGRRRVPTPAAGIIAFIGSQSYTVCFRRQAFKSEESERAQRSIVKPYRERNQLLHPCKVL